jgi:UDP-N-acetyl-2-amino-2-deoxyglucuronate dehydrogenase
MFNFALIGAAGFIAPRHLKAIKETGNNLVAALDRHDNVGILDSYFPHADFFTEFERFDRHLDKLKRQGNKVDYVSICSPNYLHDSHIRYALRLGATAICEKPLVLNPWNLDALEEIENETGNKVCTILQLRLHPSIIALKERIEKSPPAKIFDIDLNYITSRGNWYFSSWKGDQSKSGGVATNIGIHFFDMLLWIFGSVKKSEVKGLSFDTASGYLELERARVNWMLSINETHLPASAKLKGMRTHRSMQLEGEEIEFSDGFTDLHTKSYQHIFSHGGFGLAEARPSIQLTHEIRQANP